MSSTIIHCTALTKAMLLGPSLSLPVRGGKLVLGTWQQAVVINHDNRARRRRVEVTIVGR